MWREAQTAGIEIPAPPPELRTFTPSYGESGRSFNHSEFAFVPLDGDALVVEPSSLEDLGAAGQHSFMRAARRAGLAERLYQGIRGFAGFAWYDALPKLTKIELRATMEGGSEHRIEHEEPDDGSGSRGAPRASPSTARSRRAARAASWYCRAMSRLAVTRTRGSRAMRNSTSSSPQTPRSASASWPT